MPSRVSRAKRAASDGGWRRAASGLATWLAVGFLHSACCGQQVVQVPWTPTRLTHLQLWYDASDASSVSYSPASLQIDQWRDKSGKGRHATQASGSNQPRYQQVTSGGLTWCRFDGDDRLSAAVPTGTFPSSMHLIAVFRESGSNVASEAGPLTRTVGANAAPFDLYDKRRHIGNGANFTVVAASAPGISQLTSPTLLACSATSSFYREHLNGTLHTNVQGAWSYNDAATNVVIASRHAADMHFRGDIAEICAASTLADADRQRLEGYLAHKWGLAASLPNSHPYKATPPTVAVSPLVHWKLDEPSGATFANQGTLGQAAHAVAAGAVLTNQASLPVDGGRAVRLTTSHVALNQDVSGLNNPHTFLARTVELWFRADALGGRRMLYSAGGVDRGSAVYLDGSTLYLIALNRATDGPGAPWGGDGSNPPIIVACPAPILPGVTYHVAMVLDGTEDRTGTLTGYLNGVPCGSASGVGRTYAHPSLRVGRSNPTYLHDNVLCGSNLQFQGVVDDVKVWDAALPAKYFADVYRTQWGLVGHWTLDETEGTVAYDSSGLANHGNLVGTVVRESDGPRSGAYRFSSGTDHVYVPPSTSLNAIGANNGDFSVAMWVKPHATTGNWRPLFKRGLRSGSAFSRHPALWLQPTNNLVHYRISTTSNSNAGADSAAQLPWTAWTHVAVVKQGQAYRCYLNGVLNHSVTVPGATVATSVPIFIGDNPYYPGPNASIDDVRVFTRAVADGEIAELATVHVPGSADGLIAHWPLDEANGSTAYDASGNDRHATYVAVQLADEAPHPAAGDAPRFDGAAGHVNLGTIHANFAQGCSLALWAKPTNPASDERLLELASDVAGANRISLQRSGAAGALAFALQNSGDSLRVISASSALDTNRWQHYVATIQADGQAVLYVNGQPVASGALTLPASVSRPICRLAAGAGQVPKFSGNLADVRLYDYALNRDEVADLYGLVGWYRCEETSGSVAADSSGKENHAEVVGTAQWGAGLKEGSGALRLDGASYLRVDNIPLGGPHAAIAGWAKLESVGGLGADLANLGEHLVLRLDETTNGRGTTALGYSGTGYGMASSQRFYEAAGWRHYAAVLDGANGQVTLYLDGVKLGTAPAGTGLTFRELANQVTFGASTTGASDYRLQGWVDDLRIYSRPLSSAEIRTLYFRRFAPGPRIIQWREVE